MHSTEVVLADIPATVRRAQMIGGLDAANGEGLSLFELQDMLKEVFFQSHLTNRTLFESTLALYPDVALHHVDQYMSSLIKSMTEED